MSETPYRLETIVNDHAVIEEKLRSLTTEELLDHALKLNDPPKMVYRSTFSGDVGIL